MLPSLQQPLVISEDSHAECFVSITPGHTRFRCWSRTVRVDAEVASEALHSGIMALAVQSGNEVDHIAVLKAGEAIVIGVVQLHAGVVVVMKAAAGHIVALDLHTVVGGCLRYADRRFDGVVDGQLMIPPKGNGLMRAHLL